MTGFFTQPDPTAYVFGSGKIDAPLLQPDRDWRPFIAHKEIQVYPWGDTAACATFNTLKGIQTIIKRVYSVDRNYADRALAKYTDTDKKGGNDPQLISQTLRSTGAPFEHVWPSLKDIANFFAYYAPLPSYVTEAFKDLYDEFEIKHDIIVGGPDAIWDALQYSPIGISVRFDKIEDNLYSKVGTGPDNHWTLIVAGEYGKYFLIHDSAEPVFKKLAWNVAPQLAKRWIVVKKATTQELALHVQILTLIRDFWASLRRQTPPEAPKIAQDAPKQPDAQIPSSSIQEPQSRFKWGTRAEARKSVRMICDEMGLTLAEKNLICACIQQESNFDNKAVCRNKNKKGEITSSDWGLCQINDFWHVGPGKKWPSAKYIVDNPEKAVRWMISMYKQGRLNLWVSYSSGAYRKYLP